MYEAIRSKILEELGMVLSFIPQIDLDVIHQTLFLYTPQSGIRN